MTNGKLLSGEQLLPEQTLVSPGGRARLHYQGDGNLVVYLDGVPFWSSRTAGHSAGALTMQADGNLVVTNGMGQPVGASNTHGHPGAMVQLQDDGNFVIYEDPNGPSAGQPVWASSSGTFSVVLVPEPLPIPDGVLPPIAGRVEFINKGTSGIKDANGQRLVVGLHTGSLIATAFNKGVAKPQQALDYAQSRGFHFVREWTNLPAPDWWGVAPRPGCFSVLNREHEDYLRWFARELKARNLRWLVSQGDLLWLYLTGKWSKQQLLDYMAWLGRVLQQEGGAEKLAFGVDAGNEAWNFTRCTDPVLMGAMLDAFLRECPCPIRSMTSAIDEGTLNQFAGSPVTITDKHGSRGHTRMAFERSFTVGYWDGKIHPYTIDSEMPGCGPKVSATDDPAAYMEPETMGMLTLIALMAHQIPVQMSSPGVYLSDETFEQYDAQLSVGPRLAAMLPPDIQQWSLFHGGDDRSFSPERILRAPEKPGTWRCDHARGTENRYGVAVYQDAPGPLELEAINGFEGEIWNPGTLERHPIKFNKGQTVRLDFRRGRFLLGKRTT